MSFADDLWDGFTTVGKWEQQGTAMCKAICRFYRKKAKIEETYGKSLFKLVQQITDEIQQPGSSYCNDTICYGTLGSGWIATCHNTQVQAELHLNFAEQIRKNIVENLQANTLQLEDQLKQIIKDGERLLVDQDQWMSTLKKTKQSYYKAVREAEAAKSVLDESTSSKAEKRVTKAGQEAQSAELAYHQQIKHANNFMSSFHGELMPRVMKRMEDIGRSRHQLLLHHFKEVSRVSQEMPNGLISAGNALGKVINMVDVQKDIQDFIKLNKSSQQRPPPFQYEPPSEDASPSVESSKKGKHFFTLARKHKGSPPTLKGNPGTPPSLSPSPSSLVIREKAFKFSVFGNSLDEIMGHQREVLPDCEIPYFLLVLALDILRSRAFCLEGVFRVPAPTHEVETLTKQFDNGNYDLSSVQSPYTTSHLIKKWCRDLPDPLIPSYLYEKCIECNTHEEAREMLPLIPPLYNKVVVFLAQLLNEFSQTAYSEQSKMNSANFAMVFTPSFLRCASTDMADFLLNVHREKKFVQLLIECVEDRISIDNIERLMAPLDDIIFTKDNPKWHHSKREVEIPPLQLGTVGGDKGEVQSYEVKSEFQRQASEREMIMVKQQQLIKLTAKEDLSDPKILHARLLDERAEKERYQDSMMLKDKTIEVMRTELNTTLQEKLNLENSVKALQVRIEKLETQLGSESDADASAIAGLATWSPIRTNVRENIQNFERRTRSFRSGSVDTGGDMLKSARTWQKLQRSLSPSSSLKRDNRNTIHLSNIYNFRLDSPEPIAPFKLSSSPNSSSSSFLSPLTEEPTSPLVVSPPIYARRNTSSAPSSPRRNISSSPTSGPRRETVSSPRGVSFRDISSVHVYPQDGASIPDRASTPDEHLSLSPHPEVNSPRIPRIKLLNILNAPPENISPRSRHTLHVASASPLHSSPSSPTPSTLELNSPRSARHSTPAVEIASPPRAMGISSKSTKNTPDSDHPQTIGRTPSFSSSSKRKNILNLSNPIPSLKKNEGDKKLHSHSAQDKKHKQTPSTSNIDDQRIYDLHNTNVQKYDTLSKKDTTPASPKPLSTSFPSKLRLLIQKQTKSELSSSTPSISYDHKTSSKSPTSTPSPPEETTKSPRSPRNLPRPQNPRNKPQPPASPPTLLAKGTPIPDSPMSSLSSLSSTPDDSEYPATSPRQSRRTLSFPTPRAPSTSGSSLSVAQSPPPPAQPPRSTRSQTFYANCAASAQELHALALDVDKMRKEVHKRLCACIETIGNTADYPQTIEISKSIRLLIKCLDLALSKLGVDERQMRQLGTGKSTLPEMKPLAIEDSRLKKLRGILVISLDRIVDQMKWIENISSQITMQEEMNVISQTLSQLQLFFSKQDQTISKIGPQEMIEGVRLKIEELKSTWDDLSLDRQVELGKIVLDLKKDTDEFCSDNLLHAEPASPSSLLSFSLSSHSSVNESPTEGITKTIFSTLDKIHELCVGMVTNVKQRSLRHSDNAIDEGLFTEKLLEIFKTLSTK